MLGRGLILGGLRHDMQLPLKVSRPLALWMCGALSTSAIVWLQREVNGVWKGFWMLEGFAKV